MSASATDASGNGSSERGDEVSQLARSVRRLPLSCCSPSESGRLFADALKGSVTELRKDDEARMFQ